MDTLNLEAGEVLKYEVRKHWFVFVARTIPALVATLAPFILIWLGFGGPTSIGKFFGIGAEEVLFFYIIWLLAIWIYVFLEWTDYYFDEWFITNKHIIYIEQKGVFDRQTSTLDLVKVQDVTVEVKGIVAHMMDFGDIQVQTAGEDRQFKMKGARKPMVAKNLIVSG